MNTHNFRELKIWQLSMQIVEEVYELAQQLPAEEKYRLVQQIYGSSVSIPSNIAEGSGSSTIKQFEHYLNLSLSSSYELETQLILMSRIYSIDIKNVVEMINNLQRMVGGFKRSLN